MAVALMMATDDDRGTRSISDGDGIRVGNSDGNGNQMATDDNVMATGTAVVTPLKT